MQVIECTEARRPVLLQVAVEGYTEWIQLVAELTINSLNSWQWAASSVYYLLGALALVHAPHLGLATSRVGQIRAWQAQASVFPVQSTVYEARILYRYSKKYGFGRPYSSHCCCSHALSSAVLAHVRSSSSV